MNAQTQLADQRFLIKEIYALTWMYVLHQSFSPLNHYLLVS
jgi:hypothetical protein